MLCLLTFELAYLRHSPSPVFLSDSLGFLDLIQALLLLLRESFDAIRCLIKLPTELRNLVGFFSDTLVQSSELCSSVLEVLGVAVRKLPCVGLKILTLSLECFEALHHVGKH